jgi:RimJ/RimL family protein N-acetyltransferase
MAQASLQVGFRRFGFAEISSRTLPINLASQRVMEKLGFQYERDFKFAGLRHRLYRLSVSGGQRLVQFAGH